MEKLPNYGEKGNFQVNILSLLLFKICFIWAFEGRLYNFSRGVWKIHSPSTFFVSFAFSSFFCFSPLWKIKFRISVLMFEFGRDVTYFSMELRFFYTTLRLAAYSPNEGKWYFQSSTFFSLGTVNPLLTKAYQILFEISLHKNHRSCFPWDDKVFFLFRACRHFELLKGWRQFVFFSSCSFILASQCFWRLKNISL